MSTTCFKQVYCTKCEYFDCTDVNTCNYGSRKCKKCFCNGCECRDPEDSIDISIRKQYKIKNNGFKTKIQCLNCLSYDCSEISVDVDSTYVDAWTETYTSIECHSCGQSD